MPEGDTNFNLHIYEHKENEGAILEAISELRQSIDDRFDDLKDRMEKLMTDISGLEESLAGLQTADEAVVAGVSAAVTSLGALEATIAAMQAAEIPQATIDALKAHATQIGTDLTGAVSALAAAEPAPVVTPPVEPPPPPPPATPTKPVYLYSGTETPSAEWVDSGFVTAPTDGSAPQKLYYFAGDAEGGVATGAVENVWTVYTGATTPTAPAPAAPAAGTAGSEWKEPTPGA